MSPASIQASIVAVVLAFASFGCAQHDRRHDEGVPATADTPSMTLTDQVVEAGCGLCMFGMDDLPACETAIRVNGLVFLATGADIPDAEDHATGVCRTIRKARVSGRTEGDTFVATSFVLLP